VPEASSSDTLTARARAWLADDPDPATRQEVEQLLAAGDQAALAALAERFGSRLEFGTAGLRGPLGAGPNRMNRALVRRAAAGLARYLLRQATASAGVVIGFDARHQSDQFASDTAAVMAGAGIPAYVMPRPLPTPLLAYAVRQLGTAAGVMVTASHNPAADNGYKVYAADGAQIIPPTDTEISAEIDAVGSLSSVRLAPLDDPLVTVLDEGIVSRYLADAEAQSLLPLARDFGIVYTPLHGVGGSITRSLLAAAGFGRVSVVPSQAEPDPDFPTVAFPNPEEPGALDLAVAEAIRVGADVVLANDPDADRLGVAVPRRDGNGWRALQGDEIGVLLADHVLTHATGADRLVVTTIVSSDLLGRMAEAAGVHYRRTLTGFKWIVRAGDDPPGLRFVFGYEEALGFCAGTMVRDKDGITAALLFAELLAGLKASGRTVHDRLDELATRHGVHLTGQWSVRLEGPPGVARINAVMAALRAAPPAQLDGHPVTKVEDLLTGAGGALPASDVIVLHLGDRARVTVRPSGTEPKLKLYFEVVEPVGRDGVAAARSLAEAALSGLRAATATVVGL
jgi:phosphomannomutase